MRERASPEEVVWNFVWLLQEVLPSRLHQTHWKHGDNHRWSDWFYRTDKHTVERLKTIHFQKKEKKIKKNLQINKIWQKIYSCLCMYLKQFQWHENNFTTSFKNCVKLHHIWYPISHHFTFDIFWTRENMTECLLSEHRDWRFPPNQPKTH